MNGRRGGTLLLVAAAMVLGGPILWLGAPASDSGTYNWSWGEQFAALTAQGVVPPRWLPDAFGGLGSPAFVFYAPLPFLVSAPLFWIVGGVIEPNRIMGIAQVAMLAGSGLAMRAWLRPRAGPGTALLGALLYMAAPYHLFDLYVRGSIGEIAAYAVLPLLMLALERTMRAGAAQAPWLAAAVAALLLCHLPTALLSGMFLATPYLAFLTARLGPRRGALAAAAALAGLVLAAFHWVPAVGMTSANAFVFMTSGWFEASRWLLLDPASWVATGYMTFVAAASLALVAVAALSAIITRRPEAWFWCCLTVAGTLLMAGTIPALWSAPSPLARVQFPWRLLVILDFTAVTCLCTALTAAGRSRHVGMAAAWLAVSGPALFMFAAAAWATQGAVTTQAWRQVQRDLAALRPDPGEYLPAGHWLAHTASGRAEAAHLHRIIDSIGRSEAAWGEGTGGMVIAAAPAGGGALRLHVASAQGGRVVIRRFHFPAWVLVRQGDGLVLHGEPHGPDRLLSFTAPAGEQVFDLAWRWPWPQRLAVAASAIGWLLWLGAVLVCLRRRQGGIGATTHPT